MKKTIYRIMSSIMGLVLLLGSYTPAQAIQADMSVDAQTSGTPRVYAYYYLWWSQNHWRNKLGSNYPYTASPLPLPATTDADGCNAVSQYAGNQLLDVPSALYSQDDAGRIEKDIRDAQSAGITGFWLNWAGDGTTTQNLTSVTYTPRLAEAFAASTRVGGFTNWVSYKVASLQPVSHIINDLNFLYAQFGSQPSWERIDGRPVVTFTGSRKYSDADVLAVSNAVRDRMFLVGDESRLTLTDARLAMFDAMTYYWSSQDPYGNPASFDQMKTMGDKVHAAGKRWYAPLNPGYNSSLLDGGQSCIPRRNGETLRAVWNGNAASNPDGWGMISWNEIAENTHIQPMQKWGNTYVNTLASLINAAPVGTPTFTDVPFSHPFHRHIEAFYERGITTGCSQSPSMYCPDSNVTRATMAVFILRTRHGASHIPTPTQTNMFADLPVTGKEWMQPWVEEFYQSGITTGCGNNPLQFCPENTVTRATMAVFLLRAKHGPNYVPPAAANPPIFADVPVAGKEWMQPWVEEFYRQGYTTGCGTAPLRYCPESAVTRAAMAVFIVRAFNIPLP